MPHKKSSVHITKGHQVGHWLRRLIHVSMFAAPLVYYAYGERLAKTLSFSLSFLLVVLLILVVIAESLRLYWGITLFGQRNYEARQISGFASGFVALILVLLFSPRSGFSYAIIWSCAFVDPLLGELRNYLKTKIVLLIGIVCVALIWLLCAYWFAIAWWWVFLMAPLTVAVEAYPLRWIDDNAAMMLAPLALVLILRVWISV